MNKLDYLKYLKPYILFSFLLFLLSFAEGYFFPGQYPEEAKEVIEEFKNAFGPATDSGGFRLFLFIFLKNSLALISSIALGFFGGLIPIFSILANGLLVGIVAFYAVEKTSWPVFISAILPHGIFELPAFFISSAIGIKLGVVALDGIRAYLAKRPRKNEKSFKEEFFLAVKFFIVVLAPLLLIAALAETYITPLFLPPNAGL